MKKLFLTMVACMVAIAANAWTVSFTNPDNWTEVCVYAYSDNGSVKQCGDWPGEKMTNQNGTWVYENGTGTPEIVIFNNNNQNKQTGNLPFSDGATYDMDGVVGAQKYDHIVYFDNQNNWPDVYVYTWGPEIAAYNGVQLSKNNSSGLYEWNYQTTSQSSPSFGGFQFNNGKSGNDEVKTPNITEYQEGATYLPNGTIKGSSTSETLYVIGSNVNGESWSWNNMMTYKSGSTYEWEGTSLGSGFKIASYNWNGEYNIGNKDGNTISLNTPYTANNDSGSSDIAFGFEGNLKNPKITLDLSTMSITLSGTIETVDVVSLTFYIVGNNVNGNEWAFNDDAKFTYNSTNETFTWTGSTLASGFKVTDKKDWGAGNYEICSNSSQLNVGSPYTYALSGGNIEIAEGTVTNPNIVLSIKDGTITVNGETSGTTNPTPGEVVLYVKGASVNGEAAWNNNNPMEKQSDGTYKWTGTSLGSGFKIADQDYTPEYNFGAKDGLQLSLETPYTYSNGDNSSDIQFADGITSVKNPVVTLNLSDNTITVTGEPDYTQPETLYRLAGTMNGWDKNDETFTLKPVSGQDGVYSGSWDIPSTALNEDGNLAFQLLPYAETWDGQLGSEDGAFALYSSPVRTINLVPGGEGKDITIDNWAGGTLTATFNLSNNTLTLEAPGQPINNPEYLWIVGTFNNWTVTDQTYKLNKNTDGTYSGIFDLPVPEEGMYFKVVAAAKGENDWSQTYGAGTFALYSDMPYEGELIGGQEAFHITNWTAGKLSVTVGWADQTIEIVGNDQPAAPVFDGEQIYLIGEPNGWDINDNTMPLKKTETGVYSGTYNIPAGKFLFRFYTELGDWDTEGASLGAKSSSNPVNVPMNDFAINFSGDVTFSQNNWSVSGWNGGNVEITVNLNTWSVTLKGATTGTTGVDSILLDNESTAVYNLQGVKVGKDLNNLSNGIYIINGKKVVVKK